MRLEDQEASGNVEDRRGMRVGGVGGGIGIGGIAVAAIAYFLGFDPMTAINLGQQVSNMQAPAQQQAAPKGAPRDDIERLTDRIGAAQANYVVPSDAPTLPFLAEGPNFGFGGEKGEKKEQTLAELPQWNEARATVAAELADMQSQPLFLRTDQQQLGGGTHWQPTERDAEPYHPVQQEPAQTFVAEAAPSDATSLINREEMYV